MRTIICVLGIMCFLTSCHGVPDETRFMGCLHWHKSKEVIALADSLDQAEHIIYSDTAALGMAIRSLDNPFGRLLMRNTLGKAYYYMGRNLEDYHQQVVEAAECYINADRLQIDDPIYRGRVNVCIGYICKQNNNDSLALIFYERASEDFKESGNEWYYAYTLLDHSELRLNLGDYSFADTLLQFAQSYQLDNVYNARWYETRGLYFYAQQQYDSALVYLTQALNRWQNETDKLYGYLKMVQLYLDINALDCALPYAQLIIDNSNNPNYLVNAYYCLLIDANNQHNADFLSKYSHAREDANRQLESLNESYSLATQKIQGYNLNPHPWRWVGIVLSTMVAICIILAIGVWIYRQRTYIACQQIDKLSIALQDQKLRLSKELHYHHLKTIIAEAQTKYRTPLNRWLDYSVLRRDLDYWLHDWIEALDKLPLLEREKIFCTLSLVYSHLTDVSIAGYMCYGKYGIRMMKNRILKKLGIPASEFSDFLQNLTYVP